MGRLAARLLAISSEEVSFARRGFTAADESVRRHLEAVGETFVAGYSAALEETGIEALARRLDGLPRAFQGFAYEGASMAVVLTDLLAPLRRPRLPALLAGPGRAHTYLVHVGAGWALARLPVPVARVLDRLHPVQRWLAIDGFGFHEGFFQWREVVEGRREAPRRVRGYGRRAFDQGLGRSLWFVRGAEPDAIAAAVAGFPPGRRGDLWSGVGLAAGYAGGAGRPALERLVGAAGVHRPQLAQGVVFAAEARRAAANPTPATELACELVCGLSAASAAAVSDEAGRDLPPAGEEPAYEVWRRRIAARFSEEGTRVEPCPNPSAATA